MKNYEIKINIEIAECGNNDRNFMINEKVDDVKTIISESDATDIDKCEGALLRTVQPVIRQALSDHLGELSKKKLQKKPNRTCK